MAGLLNAELNRRIEAALDSMTRDQILELDGSTERLSVQDDRIVPIARD